jgi:hypothetical protein
MMAPRLRRVLEGAGQPYARADGASTTVRRAGKEGNPSDRERLRGAVPPELAELGATDHFIALILETQSFDQMIWLIAGIEQSVSGLQESQDGSLEGYPRWNAWNSPGEPTWSSRPRSGLTYWRERRLSADSQVTTVGGGAESLRGPELEPPYRFSSPPLTRLCHRLATARMQARSRR